MGWRHVADGWPGRGTQGPPVPDTPTDPLSPMLFLIAFDLLQCLVQLAEQKGLLSSALSRKANLHFSLYGDDVALFCKLESAVTVYKQILHVYGNNSGLLNNVIKTKIFWISCDGGHLTNIQEEFPGAVKSFLCMYLGLPLHTRKLRMVDIQPLLDKLRVDYWGGKENYSLW